MSFRPLKDYKQLRIDNTWAIIRNKFGGRLALFTRALDMKSSNVSRYFTEKQYNRPISDDLARRIEQISDKPRNWLDNPHHPGQDFAVPALDWLLAGQVVRREIDTLPADVEDAFVPPGVERASRFALTIDDDTMMGLDASSVPKGSIIIADTEEECTNNTLVLACPQNEQRPLFRKLTISGDHNYLTPLNERYEVISVDGTRLRERCARVVFVMRFV